MKIGIVTFNSAHNYGAVLQAWALQEYLKSEGHEPSVINYRIFDIDKLYRLYKPRNPYKKAVFNKAVHKAQDLKAYTRDKDKFKRHHAFEHFINHTLNTTQPPVYNFAQLSKAEFDFDAMIAGSDQIWNGVFTKMNPGYFLNFGKPEVKRISYAASIGKDEISDVEALQFQKYIHNFDYVSVREQKAKEQVLRFIDDEVEVVCDPTLLLPRSKYDELKKDPKIKQEYIYVHNVHLVKVDERLNAMAEELSKRTGLPIVHNRPDYSFENECGKFLDGGPEEFLGWIANARYVVANSFHATVFSMIYHREFITIPHFQNPDRMRFFLGELGIGSHLLGTPEELPEDLRELAIDYDKVEERRNHMAGSSKAFLKKALAGPRRTGEQAERKTYFDFPDPFTCYGCRACEIVCPANAITMEADKEGFIYPEIHSDKCKECGDCQKVCIYKHPSLFNDQEKEERRIFAAYNKDVATKITSSAGGVFSALANKVIEENGKVSGVRLKDDNQGEYAVAGNRKEAAAFRDAKYVTPESAGIKQEVKELLEKGQMVLYSGNPCEIAGLKAYLGKEYENLYTVDMLCTGFASPEVYTQYMNQLEEQYHSKIESIEFDNKFRGKTKGYLIVKFESGEIFLQETRKNDYMNAYKNNNIQRPSCYSCEFMEGTKSVSDITLGRYKNAAVNCPEMNDEFGTSYVQVNTRKGMELWNKANGDLIFEETDKDSFPDFSVKHPIKLTMQRSQLMNQIGEADIMKILAAFNSTKKKRRRRKR
ncbi:polysaccharide pyruvyl transferase family protein [[Clostridium] polysaccharolyticum]|uniref:Coenzyme F420-reducing hydrogenase, beta subunit n=1 Tax=[Clostridium] polysaccharolyticum TaxID=29364 RepID=A0A1H9ZES9_9FIRM|nr:polysaccharide pyruvyl transferase family protein [[Clostridium] polysaccharolyticum]SES80150.1 Coenzyme F420-reducing hydrogenase, beta subunit [[Clostridium] polysaccharolyticum]